MAVPRKQMADFLVYIVLNHASMVTDNLIYLQVEQLFN
jgi:hypothetical protein